MTDAEPLIVQRDGALALITLNRPDALNAFDTRLRCGLRDTLLDLARETAVRAVVLTGAGRLFSAGADLK
ncbi:MAG TPA: enoyl-CoA hydratase-related protein, partial [Gammaproteobacteria bacterium]|nr:enoyl-CoA hydratase-related protein [Gammaproteobacteria bacterium]